MTNDSGTETHGGQASDQQDFVDIRVLGTVDFSNSNESDTVRGTTYTYTRHGSLYDSSNQETVIRGDHSSYKFLQVGGAVIIEAQNGGSMDLYTLTGERIKVNAIPLDGFRATIIGGRELCVVANAMRDEALFDPAAGEFLTDFHHYLTIDGRTVKGNASGSTDCFVEVVEVEPTPIIKLEEELADDGPGGLPEVTDEVEAVCDEYITHNDFEWVLDLENELEDAMT